MNVMRCGKHGSSPVRSAVLVLPCIFFVAFALNEIHMPAANGYSADKGVAAGYFEVGRVEVPMANLRAKPSTDSPIVAKLPRGADVLLLLKRGPWYVVRHSGQSLAWGHEALFQKTKRVLSGGSDETWGRVRVRVGKVREKPDIVAPVISSIMQGDRVAILDRENEWHVVELPDSTLGWAHQKLFHVHELGLPEAVSTEQWNELKEIQFEAVSVNEERVFFKLSHQRPPNTFSTRRGEPMVVCEFLAARLGKLPKGTMSVEGHIVRRIRVSEGGGLLPTVIVTMDLVHFPGSDYQVQPVLFEKENLYTLILRRVRRE